MQVIDPVLDTLKARFCVQCCPNCHPALKSHGVFFEVKTENPAIGRYAFQIRSNVQMWNLY